MGNQLDLTALWKLSYGVYVVSARSGEKTNGQIVNTVFQVAAEPPLVAVSINKSNLTHDYIVDSGAFSVSILDEETDLRFIGLFGFQSGRNVDKMYQVAFKKGIDDCPIVTDHTLASLEVKVRTSVDVGTHTVFIGEVKGAENLREGKPLTYAYYHQVKKMKSPKTAPTYIPPKK